MILMLFLCRPGLLGGMIYSISQRFDLIVVFGGLKVVHNCYLCSEPPNVSSSSASSQPFPKLATSKSIQDER
ncbi:hypothetical protein Y032_0627g812 [Ancylostoma ceylanicum]|uniref:Secreted protein n=1 Tax=Ancylostoma ceylanicum TaxID=53326 RepID=A0A016WMA6_9BILA|nr:hypothetical protein Y032_0627g812 [Ancylostoma ceylanicum]